jgi:NTP pyrophosphatase (non-canonical NTP hydrolase)
MDTQINFIDDQKDILKHFGIEAQIEKFFEEVEELREAIKLKNKVMIREELADVHNVLMQLIFHYGVRMIYKKAVDKLLRTKERIRSNYYEQRQK